MQIIDYIGNRELLQREKTLFICSKLTPFKLYDVVFSWVDNLTYDSCIVCFNSTELEEEVMKALIVREIPTILVVMDKFTEVNNTQIHCALQERRMLIIVLKRDEQMDLGATPRLRNEFILEMVQHVVCGYVNKNGSVFPLVNTRNNVSYLFDDIPIIAAEETIKHGRWTIAEDKILLSMHYADMGLHAIKKRLQRSYLAVRMRIRSISLSDEALKGREFEDFVVELFNLKESKTFHLLEWKGDKLLGDIYPEGNRHPDLILEYMAEEYKPVSFAVECKWRNTINRESFSNMLTDEKYSIYLRFSEEQQIPVYIVLGIGGQPSAPLVLYVFRLEDIPSIQEKKIPIIKYMKSFPTDDFCADDFLGLEAMSKRIEKNEQSTTHKNAYAKWNDKADNQLCILFHQGISIEQLSELFGRTKGAIRCRLKKLNVIQEDN